MVRVELYFLFVKISENKSIKEQQFKVKIEDALRLLKNIFFKYLFTFSRHGMKIHDEYLGLFIYYSLVA